MRPAFTSKPLASSMATEKSTECVGMKFHGTVGAECIDILCVDCGWTGHFPDGSTDHFFNHKCKLRTESVSTHD